MLLESIILGVFILVAVIVHGAMNVMLAKMKLAAMAQGMKTVTSMLPNMNATPMGLDDLPEDFDGPPAQPIM